MLFEILWRRGSYCAELDGPDPKWGYDRSFMQGTPVKGRGVLQYDLAPGWYATREGRGVPEKFWRIDGVSAEVLAEPHTDRIDILSTGPNPGEAGEWYGPTCACGSDVESFDSDGWPHCAEHQEGVAA